MKFVISRTSHYGKDKPPCEEAREETILSGGEKQFEYEAWCLDINTIEELIKFIEKNGGSAVIEKSYWTQENWEIEIYDDYRE